MPSATAVNVEHLATVYGDAWNEHDLDGIIALHTDDTEFRLHVPGGEPVAGKEAVRAAFAAFIEQIPDMHFAPRQLRLGADHWVLESRLTGTVAGSIEVDGERVAAPGQRVDVDCVDVFEVRDGLVASKHTYLDAVTFLRQLGLAP
jgi:steroid delta-isomerase-like uncharacterized protein